MLKALAVDRRLPLTGSRPITIDWSGFLADISQSAAIASVTWSANPSTGVTFTNSSFTSTTISVQVNSTGLTCGTVIQICATVTLNSGQTDTAKAVYVADNVPVGDSAPAASVSVLAWGSLVGVPQVILDIGGLTTPLTPDRVFGTDSNGEVVLKAESGGGGGSVRYSTTFVQADLTIANLLPVTHNLGEYPAGLNVIAPDAERINPDRWQNLTTSSLMVDLSSFVPLTGTYRLELI